MDERLEREAALLRPYVGQFVAVDPTWTEVITAAGDPRTVVHELRATDRTGVVFQVPVDPTIDVSAQTDGERSTADHVRQIKH